MSHNISRHGTYLVISEYSSTRMINAPQHPGTDSVSNILVLTEK